MTADQPTDDRAHAANWIDDAKLHFVQSALRDNEGNLVGFDPEFMHGAESLPSSASGTHCSPDSSSRLSESSSRWRLAQASAHDAVGTTTPISPRRSRRPHRRSQHAAHRPPLLRRHPRPHLRLPQRRRPRTPLPMDRTRRTPMPRPPRACRRAPVPGADVSASRHQAWRESWYRSRTPTHHASKASVKPRVRDTSESSSSRLADRRSVAIATSASTTWNRPAAMRADKRRARFGKAYTDKVRYRATARRSG